MKKALALSFLLFLFAVVVAPVFADTINLQPVNGVVDKNIQISDVVSFVINLLVVISIVASLIFLIYGGLRWVISGGDKEKVENARKTVVAAIIGLVVVLLSWVIITIVLQVITGKGLANFEVPTLGNSSTKTKSTP